MLAPLLALVFASQARGPVDLPPDAAPYRETKEMGSLFGITPLREAAIPKGDLELRVWYGFAGEGGTHVIVLRRMRDVWNVYGSKVIPAPGDPDGGLVPAYGPLTPPKQGWNRVWLDLKALGVLTIPDEASLPDDGTTIADGRNYLFEIRRGDAYRAYYYDNPDRHPSKLPTAKILRMVRVLAAALPPDPERRFG